MAATGATPIRALPYPVGTNPVDVAGDMQLLATRLDNDGGRTPAKVFANKAAIDAGTSGWPDGAMAMTAAGVMYEKVEGTWRLRDEMPVWTMPVVAISHGNVPEGLTPSIFFVSMLRRPYNCIWRGSVHAGLSGHSAKGSIRVRFRDEASGIDQGITAPMTYYAGDSTVYEAPFSFWRAAGAPLINFRVWWEIGGTGANTNINGGILFHGYATSYEQA
jgi:hypothetical protein